MSYPAFTELMRINPQNLRFRQAEIMNELSVGIAIRNGFDMAEMEFCEFFGRNLRTLREISYRVETVWCPVGHMVVEKYPYHHDLPADDRAYMLAMVGALALRFSSFREESADGQHVNTLASSVRWSKQIANELTSRLTNSPEVLKLQPTERSRLMADG